jgi:elongation factor G
MTVGKPRVVHRETIRAAASATGSVDRVIDAGGGTLELKATCVARVEPKERGTGVEVLAEPTWDPPDWVPTAEQRSAVEQGSKDALAGGPVEGSPLQDVRVRLERVGTFGPASSAQALRIAAATAVREALLKAGGVLMQPIMRLEVVVPEENTGTVLGDLQSRGAVILNHASESQTSRIDAECGLSHLIGYTTDLRSVTRGRGQFTMEFDRFDVL